MLEELSKNTFSNLSGQKTGKKGIYTPWKNSNAFLCPPFFPFQNPFWGRKGKKFCCTVQNCGMYTVPAGVKKSGFVSISLSLLTVVFWVGFLFVSLFAWYSSPKNTQDQQVVWSMRILLKLLIWAKNSGPYWKGFCSGGRSGQCKADGWQQGELTAQVAGARLGSSILKARGVCVCVRNKDLRCRENKWLVQSCTSSWW